MAKRAKSRPPSEGAKPAAMPGFIKPQLATLKSKAPKGETWLHEIKYDGYRVQLNASGERVAAYTRNGLDWAKRFAGDRPRVRYPAKPSWTARRSSSRRPHQLLRASPALAGGRQGRIEYYAFDLLYLDGYDLRAVAQLERKRLLKDLFDRHRRKCSNPETGLDVRVSADGDDDLQATQ